VLTRFILTIMLEGYDSYPDWNRCP